MNLKKTAILSFLFVLLTATLLHGENNPYRSDYLWVARPDHADWNYRAGEKASIDVEFYKYGIPQNCEVTYTIGNDMLADDEHGTIKLVNGHGTIKAVTRKTPGFRVLRLSTVIDGVKYDHHIGLAFSPNDIEPYTQMPKDFTDFWDKAKADAARFPLRYTRERAEEYCTDKIDCWLIRLELNGKGQCMYGYLTMPKDAKPGAHPVVLCPPGAGVKTIKEPLRHKYYAENGFIRLEMEIHGLDPRMTAQQFSEISKALNLDPNGYLCQGLDNRDNYYMKRVYLGMMRCIDFLQSLPEWDGRNTIVQGGSQGGALAIVTAGLDPRVTLCVANHPALSDMAGYVEPGRTGGYPHFVRMNGMLTPEKVKTIAYYDVVNFARLVKAESYLTWGYCDTTCPPTTSYAVWNTLACPKESLITPINEHWTSETTEQGHMKWIKKHLK